jgi:hypothetical protein
MREGTSRRAKGKRPGGWAEGWWQKDCMGTGREGVDSWIDESQGPATQTIVISIETIQISRCRKRSLRRGLRLSKNAAVSGVSSTSTQMPTF